MKKAVAAVFFGAVAACGGGPSTPPASPIERINAEGLRRLDHGDDVGAEEAFRDALREAELIDDLVGQAEAWNNLGALATARGKPQDAWAYHAAALRLHGASGKRDAGEVRTRTNLGGAMLACGERRLATEQFEEAVRLAASLHDDRAALLPRVGLASVHLAGGDPAAVAAEAARIGNDAATLGDDGARAAALAVEGSALELAGNFRAARDRFAAAHDLDRKRAEPSAVASDLVSLARVSERIGDRTMAADYLARASRIARQLGALDLAEKRLRRALALTGDSPDAASLRAELEALEAARRAARTPSGGSGESSPHDAGARGFGVDASP